MGKYEKQFDDEKIICPYCGHSRRADAGDFSEDDEVRELNLEHPDYWNWRLE